MLSNRQSAISTCSLFSSDLDTKRNNCGSKNLSEQAWKWSPTKVKNARTTATTRRTKPRAPKWSGKVYEQLMYIYFLCYCARSLTGSRIILSTTFCNQILPVPVYLFLSPENHLLVNVIISCIWLFMPVLPRDHQ